MKYVQPTKVCKLCFKDIPGYSLINLLRPNLSLCSYCFKQFKPIFYKFKILDVPAESIYYYGHSIKTYLYQLKGCHDIELAPIFLERFAFEYRLKYLNYILVPAPSAKEDDEKRGFNHVIEIFKILKLPIERVIKKTCHYKQSDHNREERKEIKKHLVVENGEILRNKNVLIVDDVCTTGSTLKAIINLIKPFKPKTIRILVMSKTDDEDYI